MEKLLVQTRNLLSIITIVMINNRLKCDFCVNMKGWKFNVYNK